ncbi:Fur family transcriptional regulator [Companilactobacillus sp. FL22-1]|uniref:Fur family transcriptional regulator n=1 Tax=Companilactobacillus sp. FL22-1 TaxID=3373892 RepID=UPI003754F012
MLEKALKILKQNNYKITKQRTDLIDYLQKFTVQYVSINDIANYMRTLYPGMSNNTIYRNLKEFAEIGLVEYQEKDKTLVKYQCDFDHRHHHHFVCKNCGKVTEIESCPIEFFEKQLPGYMIEGHTIEVYGLCPECIKKLEVEV